MNLEVLTLRFCKSIPSTIPFMRPWHYRNAVPIATTIPWHRQGSTDGWVGMWDACRLVTKCIPSPCTHYTERCITMTTTYAATPRRSHNHSLARRRPTPSTLTRKMPTPPSSPRPADRIVLTDRSRTMSAVTLPSVLDGVPEESHGIPLWSGST